MKARTKGEYKTECKRLELINEDLESDISILKEDHKSIVEKKDFQIDVLITAINVLK